MRRGLRGEDENLRINCRFRRHTLRRKVDVDESITAFAKPMAGLARGSFSPRWNGARVRAQALAGIYSVSGRKSFLGVMRVP